MHLAPKHLFALLLALPGLAAAQGLGIDIGGQKPVEKKPPAPMTLDVLNVAGRSAGRQRTDAAKKLYDDKAYEAAAEAFDEILRDKSIAAEHDEARYRLAQSLEKLGLYYSAFSRYEEILAKGPQGSKYYFNGLDGLFASARHMANDRVVLAGAARFGNEKMPAEYQDRLNLLLARYHYERGRALMESGQAAESKRELEEARRLAALVRPGATSAALGPDAGNPTENLAARARFVDGSALYALGKEPEALEAFKDVIRFTNPRKTTQTDTRVRELAFLQLARIHYEHKQNRYAIWYFAKMPWGEPLWLEGLWESSYAHYRIGDYEKALGNLLTLHSPFFVDEYFPESYILKAVIYYENCRYPEARAILEDFARRYEPVYQELMRLAGRRVPNATFYEEIELGEKVREADRGSLVRKVLKIALTDDAIYRLNDSILQIEKEMDEGVGGRPRFSRTALGEDLLARLKADRARLVEEAGARARQKLEAERDDLRRLLEQGLRIKIEVARKEREALEASLAKGAPVNVLRPYKFSAAVSDEHEYWPYEGESWRDELGTYSYTLTRGCREGPGKAVSP